jgi:hypothetical protein
MQQPVEHRGGDNEVPEDLSPRSQAPIAGENHWSAFVTPANQLQEQIRSQPFDRQVADLGDDQQPRG